MRRVALLSTTVAMVLVLVALPSHAAGFHRWSARKAQAWYVHQPWILGSNYVPANAINELQMWQASTFDPKRINLEFTWAHNLGINTMRVFLHNLLWQQDPEGFKHRIRIFLRIAEQHQIKIIFVLFDSCWDPDPRLGPQRPPIPGVHNSGWVQSPGAKVLEDPADYGELKAYVRGVVGAFAHNKQILAWDVWNEPDNSGGGNYADKEPINKFALVAALLPKVFAWARSVHPMQPLTSPLWHGGNWSDPGKLNAIEKIQVADSDIITFHNYGWPEQFYARVKQLEIYGRPIICTEYMARSAGSTIDGVLPVGKRMNVGMINWGFVHGKTQTNLPWSSWQRPYVFTQPLIWFHDLLHRNGRPYREREAELLRSLSAAPRGVVPDNIELGGVVSVYRPNIRAYPHGDASYPRVIRLEHAGVRNGTLLATFSHSNSGSSGDFPIYQSSDNGWTWTGPIGFVRATVRGWGLDAPTLFELPHADGDLPAGTLLAAGTAWKSGHFGTQEIQVFDSRDDGRNWSYYSTCASEHGLADKGGIGIWEPSFAIASNGNLVCYFSDERQSANGYNQELSEVVSTDGGKSWGPEKFVVRIHDGVQRPGMITVVRLPNGLYAATFEDCRRGFNPDETCSVYFKTSRNGVDWGSPSDLGKLIKTRDGTHLLHTPMIAWSSWGGRDGTIIVSGQRVVNGQDGALTVRPQSGQVLMINSHLGRGTWREIRSPVIVNPTGGYDPGETPCPGYSAGILPDTTGPGFQVVEALRMRNGRCRVVDGHGWLPARN